MVRSTLICFVLPFPVGIRGLTVLVLASLVSSLCCVTTLVVAECPKVGKDAALTISTAVVAACGIVQ
jgi:hypothetical protein